MKLTQKVDHFTVFNSFPIALVAAHRSSRQITYKKYMVACEVVSGMFSLGGWVAGDDGLAGKGYSSKLG